MTLDPGTADGRHALERLRREIVIWFTSVTPSGQPQSFPVWYLWDDDSIVLYSANNAKRNDNLEANPKVSLHLEGGEIGEDVVVIEGRAVVDPDLPPVHDNPAYLEKYAESFERISMTPQEMARNYDVRIRVTPTRIRVYRG